MLRDRVTMRPSTVRASNLTERQAETLEAIRAHIEKWGMPPSRNELARTLGLKFHSSVNAHLKALARKGWVELIPSMDRGIRLLREGTPILALDDVPTVAAGNPMLAEESEAATRMNNIEAVWLRFDQTPDYLVVVQGDSMNKVGLKSGDVVAIRQHPDPREGDIVIARIGSDVTLKRYHRAQAGVIELQPQSTNPEHETLYVEPDNEDFEIVGIVVGAIIGPPRDETDNASASRQMDA